MKKLGCVVIVFIMIVFVGITATIGYQYYQTQKRLNSYYEKTEDLLNEALDQTEETLDKTQQKTDDILDSIDDMLE